MSSDAYEIQALSAGYPGRGTEVLRGLNLSIRVGEWVLLAGPNGCGKSTLLRAVAGDPSIVVFSGTHGWASRPPGAQAGPQPDSTRAATQGTALLPQDVGESLFSPLTVAENLVLALSPDQRTHRGLRLSRRTADALDFARGRFPGLLEFSGSLVSELSGGWRAVLALAMALRRRPRLLLLDEVAAALDEQNSALFWQALREWAGLDANERPAVIFVSHQVLTARKYACRAVFMRDGIVAGEINGPALAALDDRGFVDAYREKCW